MFKIFSFFDCSYLQSNHIYASWYVFVNRSLKLQLAAKHLCAVVIIYPENQFIWMGYLMNEGVKISEKLNKFSSFSNIMSRKKIIIIDHQSIFRAGLIFLLKTPLPDAQIYEASTLDEALRNYQSADLVLLDLSHEQLNSMKLSPLIKTAWPDAKVIILSSSFEVYEDVVTKGADGFLSKTLLSCQIVSAIISVLAETRGHSAYVPKLTKRQLHVLELMNRGMSNKMIANECGISEHTVRWHVQLILIELEASNRLEAIFNARNFGLISSPGR